MRVLTTFPPNFQAINERFNVRGKPIIFAFGDVIHNPGGRTRMTPALLAHEAVHGARQLALPGGPAEWWQRYIADPQFRLIEEIPAHRAEFAVLRTPAALVAIAERLASPLYGRLIEPFEAQRLILYGNEGAAR